MRRQLLVFISVALPLSAQLPERIPPRPIAAPAAFARAVAQGTRGLDGRPGPRYWQQEAHYVIAATLDPAAGTVSGRMTLTYVNHAPDTLASLLFHLDQNVFRAGAQRNRAVVPTNGFTLSDVTVDNRAAAFAPAGPGYYDYPTLAVLPLPSALAPGDTVRVQLAWSHRVPRAPTFRTANLDDRVFAIAQWHPRVAVYDDLYGWNATPYLGDGEFYLEYGRYDVALTVPAGWLIGATGTLTNPGDVLTPDVARRLALSHTGDSALAVVREAEIGRATRGNGPITWRFHADSVRDFAFSASPDYVWDAGRTAGGVMVHALYRPRFPAWREAWRYGAHAIRTLSRDLGPYAWPQVTVAEGPIGGMEYPMIVFITAGRDARSLAGVIIHEVAHEWFPMMVGSMEAKHPWMDEGFVSYWDELSAAELWGDPPPRWGANRPYLLVAGTEREVPLMRHTDLVNPHGARTLAAYTKPAVVLGALRSLVGDETFLAAFRDYFATWRMRHPQPWDFFHVVERHVGQPLHWFWRPLFFETDVLDHQLARVSASATGTEIVIWDAGDVLLPTLVRVTYGNGTVWEEVITPLQWMTTREIVVGVRGQAIRVELDPDLRYPDVRRDNNRWDASGTN